jgi:large subunit ribosomal protein L25
MNKVDLQVSRRENGKKAVKAVRNSGLVPGIFYMKGQEPISISANPKSLKSLVYTAETKFINLQIEGIKEPKECFIKDLTFDPVTDKLTHIDLMGINRNAKMTFEIPVIVKGSAIGVKEGGILQQNIHKMNIRCNPNDLPTSIEIDVTDYKVGKALHIRDLSTEIMEYILPADTTIVQVAQPRVGKVETTAE